MCNKYVNETLNNAVKEYVNYQTGEVLDLERVSQLKDNAMLKVRPDLWCEWNFEENDKLGLDIWMMPKGNGEIKAYWWCFNNDHPYDMPIPRKVKGGGCSYCSGHRLLVGFNDMWTTNPKLASLLANPEDGYKYMQCSNKYVDWKCPDCNNIVENKEINNVNGKGLICDKCRTGFSFSERIMRELLMYLEIKFLHDKNFKWSNSRRYDFIVDNIDNIKIIIEMHGLQHYEQTRRKNARSLEEEQVNDKYKYVLAIANGINPENYIEIDCRKSDFEFIKENIINSRLSEILALNNVDWEEVKLNTYKSIIKNVADLWNEGLKMKEIAEKTRLNRSTLINYLYMANEVNMCNYTPREAKIRGSSSNNRPVVKLDLEGNYICTYDNLKLAGLDCDIAYQGILSVCQGKLNKSGGFKWVYKNDYEKVLNGEMDMPFRPKIKKTDNLRKVVQLSLIGNFIKEWESITEASDNSGANSSSIILACRDTTKTSGGYRWMYKEDYEKVLSGEIEVSFKSRENYKSRKIIQLDLKGNYIKEWNSMTNASTHIGVDVGNISVACKSIENTSGGFRWLYKEDYEKYLKGEITISSNIRTGIIVQLDLEGKFIKQWNSIKDASENLGINGANISSVCRGKAKTIKGFRWMYLEDYENLINNGLNILPPLDSKFKKIVQLNEDGTYVKIWNSMSEASESIGVNRATMTNYCKGKKKDCKGFKWIYKEDYDKYIEEQKLGVEQSTPFIMQ